MKRKILTKLISAVCAAAIATSCTAMSVGAVPPKGQDEQAEQTKPGIDWTQSRDRAKELLSRAQELRAAGGDMSAFQAFAGDFNKFFSSDQCIEGLLASNSISIYEVGMSVSIVSSFLKSDSLEKRQNAAYMAADDLANILKLIEEHIL